jgi:ribosome maturation factor RimP
MAIEAPVRHIEKLIDDMLAAESEYFRISVKIKPTNNVKVFIDGDRGISIEKCVQFNRKLYKMIEISAIFPPGEFSLEVSSPGVDEPLKLLRQYSKNIGRSVEVIFNDGTKKRRQADSCCRI